MFDPIEAFTTSRCSLVKHGELIHAQLTGQYYADAVLHCDLVNYSWRAYKRSCKGNRFS